MDPRPTSITPEQTAPQRCEGDYHPLEMISFFRRFRPNPVRDIIYTFIWNGAIGAGFWILSAILGGGSSIEQLAWYLIIANMIGYAIHGLFELGAFFGIERRARAKGHIATTFYYSIVSTTGVVGGFAAVGVILDRRFFVRVVSDPQWLVVTVVISFIVSVVLSAISFGRARQARAEAALERERLRAERVEREAARATLRALQAQIEPHFLFNTLANVASLIDSDPALSKRMLERFIRFLRASLAATRGETTTLAAEGELISAYLDVLQVRMGPRLRYAVSIEPALQGFALPPMLLQPIVENAIKHGVEPRVEGGEVRLAASSSGGKVRIDVTDTGVGFAQATRGGTGLTNLRERLKLLYAERASVAIADNPGGGTTVTVWVPA
jgi:signal transduction histidine kinase